MALLKNRFISGESEIYRSELLGLTCPIDSTMLSDKQMQEFVDTLEAHTSFKNDPEGWWRTMENLAINIYNMRYYEDYTEKERYLADKRIKLIKNA